MFASSAQFPVKTALLSVTDKTGLSAFAAALSAMGITLYSSGGTALELRKAGVAVSEVSELTQFPESFDGRVKTLHPKLHGGILLNRASKKHLAEAATLGIPLIDLVVVNLYAFEKAAVRSEIPITELVEQIDIGGPALLRAAAKNYKFVTVVSERADYALVLKELQENEGHTTLRTREHLAQKAFLRTAGYDAAIAEALEKRFSKTTPAVATAKASYSFFRRSFNDAVPHPLRYGENPHQSAQLFKASLPPAAGWSVPHSRILAGKEMSYNNYLDAEAAVRSVSALQALKLSPALRAAAVVIKHGNPCGLALAKDPARALLLAWQGDVTSAFGSVVAVNEPLGLTAARFFEDKFIELLIAPAFSKAALAFFKASNRHRTLRLVELAGSFELPAAEPPLELRTLAGGFLVQQSDETLFPADFALTTATEVAIPASDFSVYAFSFLAAKRLKSNAVVVGVELPTKELMLLATGSGQPNRIECITRLVAPRLKETLSRLSTTKLLSELPPPAELLLARAVLASDAFFPFPDAVEAIKALGVEKIIQPGGSLRDREVIQRAKQLRLAMALTKRRHFLH